MARSVVAGHPLTTDSLFSLRGLPRLSELALQSYSKLLPKRLKKFPQPPKDQARRPVILPEEISIDNESLQSLSWTHELHHDAESVFWLLVWWAIHLRHKSSSSSKINSVIFGYLTNIDLVAKRDGRMLFLNDLANKQSWLAPEYQGLEPLFQRMASHLTDDLYWAKYGSTQELKEPEFLHEALQRIIFDFLMENKTEDFMNLEKDTKNREVERQIPRHAEKQVTPSKRSNSTMETTADEPEAESRVSFLSSPAVVHTTYPCRARHAKRHVGESGGRSVPMGVYNDCKCLGREMDWDDKIGMTGGCVWLCLHLGSSYFKICSSND